MASTAKKGKKPKSKSLSLQEFLSKDNDNLQAGYNLVTAKRPGLDWADDVEPVEQEDVAYNFSSKDQYILPSAPLGPSIDMAKFPTSPPFTAFIGNLPFDAEDADISHFFKDLKVSNIRLLRHPGENGRLRGFGYVEFDDRQSLLDALGMTENFIKSSKIKIDIAGNQDEHGRPRKDRNDRNDRSDRPDRTGGNWRLDNREERAEETMSRDRFGSDRDRFGDKDREERGGGGRFGSDRSFGGDRFSDRADSGRRERSGFDRGGSSDDRGSYRNFGSDRNQRDYSNGFERRDGNQGGGRRDYGSGYRNNDDRQSDRSGNFDRSRNPNFGNQNAESSAAEPRESEGEAPKERRRLVLQPRSKPLSEASEPGTTSSIFGGAKPVDTAAREREIEQRLTKERDLALSKANDLRSRDIDRVAPSYDEAEDNSDHKRGSVGRSPKSSVSVHSGGASSYHSETDEEKSERSLPLSNAPLSPKAADEVKPAPPPKENAWAKRAQSVPQPSEKYVANNRNAAQKDVDSQDENSSRNRRDDYDSRKGRSDDEERPNTRPRSKDNGKSKELPKFEAPPPPNYASSNKFGQLYSSDED